MPSPDRSMVRITSMPGASDASCGGQDALGQRSAVMGTLGTNGLYLCLSTRLEADKKDFGVLDALKFHLLLLTGLE